MIIVFVKVKPGSFKDEIVVDTNDTLVIKIREKPIDGAANNYLIKYLAKELDISKSAITIEKGATSQFKKISINLKPDEFKQKIDKYR